MQPLFRKYDRAALGDTCFDHSWIMTYNGLRNARVMAFDRPAKLATEGDDFRFAETKDDWTLDEVVMPLKAAVRYGDFRNWEEPPLTELESAISQFAEFEREIVKGPAVKRGDAVYWASWGRAPLYRAGAFDAFHEAVDNLEGLANALAAGRR